MDNDLKYLFILHILHKNTFLFYTFYIFCIWLGKDCNWVLQNWLKDTGYLTAIGIFENPSEKKSHFSYEELMYKLERLQIRGKITFQKKNIFSIYMKLCIIFLYFIN